MQRLVSRRKAAAATLLGSSASTLIAAMQAVILMPLYLREVGPSLYGAWMATGEILIWMMALDLGIPNVLIQRISGLWVTGDKHSAARIFATGGAILTAVAGLLFIGLWLVAPLVAGVLSLSAEQASALVSCFRIASLATALMLVSYLFQALGRALQRTIIINAFALLGTLAGFAVTTGLLLSGYGLSSLAIGLLVRSSASVVGGLCFWIFKVDTDFKKAMRPDRTAFRNLLAIAPAAFGSSLAYSLMSNSQVFLATLLCGPAMGVIFGLTRKALDLCRAVLDAIGYASYGGFAHLFASGEMTHSRRVLGQIIGIYAAASVSALAAYLAVNSSLVTLWAGPEFFGGYLLSVLMALSLFARGLSYLLLTILRATGSHGASSGALATECVARLLLMVALTSAFGLVGLPLGAIVTATASAVWAWRRVSRRLGGSPSFGRPQTWVLRGLALGGALLLGLFVPHAGWAFVLLAGSAVAGITLFLQVRSDSAVALAVVAGGRSRVEAAA